MTSGAAFLRATVVLIPAFNEAGCVAATVRAWRGLGAARIRVVDNASTDETGLAARQAGAEVLFEPRRGYGAAAHRGLQEWPEGMTWVLFSSADGSDRLTGDEAVEWQRAVDEGAGLVTGDRVSRPESRVHLKPVQRFGNWLTCQVIRAGWGRRFRDLGSLRLARRRSLVDLGLVDRAFGWNVEMQVRAIEHGWKIVELPVRYAPRTAGESKISGSWTGTMRAGCGILATLLWLWRLHGSRQVNPAQPRCADAGLR